MQMQMIAQHGGPSAWDVVARARIGSSLPHVLLVNGLDSFQKRGDSVLWVRGRGTWRKRRRIGDGREFCGRELVGIAEVWIEDGVWRERAVECGGVGPDEVRARALLQSGHPGLLSLLRSASQRHRGGGLAGF